MMAVLLRYLIVSLVGFCLLTVVARAQPSGPTYQNLTVLNNVTLPGLPSGTPATSVCRNSSNQVITCPLPTTATNFQVSNTTELSLLATTAAPNGVWRATDGVAGAPPLFFTPWGSACSLNAGAGDGGSQVRSADSKCWLGQFPVTGADVREWGAIADGSTDVTAAIQAAITWASSTGGGLTVLFPSGNMCVKSGPLTATSAGVTLQGLNKGSNGTGAGPLVSACGTDTALVVMSGAGDTIRNIAFKGSQVPGTTKDTVAMIAGCSECTLDFVGAQGGRHAISATDAYEVYLLHPSADSVYGDSIVYLHAVSASIGGYIFKGKFDQAYPFATPAAGSVGASIPAWASGHVYTAGQIVSANGYNLQATIGGTSGGSAPATPPYGTVTVDGEVSWGLVGKSGNYGVLCDGANCGSDLFVNLTDFSGDESIGFGAINSAHGITLDDDTFGSNLVNNVLVDGGYGVTVHHSHFGGGLATIGTAISFVFAGDDNFVVDNWIIQGGPASGSTGVYMDGNNIVAEGNICSVATCFSVPANVSHFRIVGNSCFSGFGATTTCAYIAPGTSDYYAVALNDAGGSTTSVNDGGTGTHKIIFDEDNLEYGLSFPSYVHTPTPAASIASGFGSGPAISGSNVSGRITVGSGGASTGVVTLGTNTQVHFPNCTANDETSAIGTRVAATASNQLTFGTVSGSWSAGDNLTYTCGAN
jgi:Pectate lyase superfamily protein